jgi:CopG family nickel-responsive transcriptional regulator
MADEASTRGGPRAGKTVRFTVSLEAGLMDRIERFARRHGVKNRSEFLRDLMRDALVREEWSDNEEIVGTVTIVYDHHRRELSERLTHLQHEFHDAILSSLHVHLDRAHCLEVVALRGKAGRVQKIADALIGTRGVLHGKLAATTTGRRLR